jgi:hypothetical protein
MQFLASLKMVNSTMFLLQSASASCCAMPVIGPSPSHSCNRRGARQANEQRHERNELMGVHEKPPPTVKEIDAPADDEVDRLYHDSLRAYANSVRQPPGLIA